MRPWSLAALGYGLLMMAWAVSNPPFAAPDEVAQFTRAASFARGDFGRTPDYGTAPQTLEQEWFRRVARVVSLPDDLHPVRQIPCFALRGAVTADCADASDAGTVWVLPAEERLAVDITAPPSGEPIEAMVASLDVEGGPGDARLVTTTYVGDYPPFVLVPAGLAANAASALGAGPDGALLAARLAGLVVTWLLVAAGLRVLLRARPGAAVLAGAALALTPMTLFVSAVVAPSGVEVAAAFALTAAVVDLARPARSSPPRGSWLLLGASGVLLALARQGGPAWIFLAFAAVWAFVGRGAWADPRARRVALAAVAASLAMVAWDVIVMPRAPATPTASLSSQVGDVLREAPTLGREIVGVFGWLDVPLPIGVPLVWSLAAAALVIAAGVASDRRRRLALAGLVAALLPVAVGIAVFAAHPIGTRPQGRWLLPLAVAIPVVAGALAAGRERLMVGAVVLAATAHVLALWANARRYAVGTDGPWLFLGSSRWEPPLGWVVWLAVGVAGAAALVASAVRSATAPARPGPAGSR